MSMTVLTLESIHPDRNLQKAFFGFHVIQSGCPNGYNSSWGEIINYDDFIKIIKDLGKEKKCQLLTDRVKQLNELPLPFDALRQRAKTDIDSFNRRMLGKELIDFNISFTRDYDPEPVKSYLCDLVAKEEGKIYAKPTLEEALRHVASCILQNKDPYPVDKHLIKQEDIKDLYYQIHNEMHLLLDYFPGKGVLLEVVTAKDLQSAHIECPPPCECGLCYVFIRLEINCITSYYQLSDSDFFRPLNTTTLLAE